MQGNRACVHRDDMGILTFDTGSAALSQIIHALALLSWEMCESNAMMIIGRRVKLEVGQARLIVGVCDEDYITEIL